MNMKISTNTNPLEPYFSVEKCIEHIAKTGFDAFDLSLFSIANVNWKTRTMTPSDSAFNSHDYEKYSLYLKQVGLDNGIICNQSHAPFPSNEKNVDLIKKGIEITSLVGGKYCIVHPNNDWSADKNADFYLSLLPFAKDLNVIICTENMWNWNGLLNHAAPAACSDGKSFLEMIKKVNSPYLQACVDIGHAEMKGLKTSSEKMILSLGEHVKTLHIHDNDKVHDLHILPFTGKIDFSKMIKALKTINYSGYFTLEVEHYLNTLPQDKVLDGLKTMYKTCKELAHSFDVCVL